MFNFRAFSPPSTSRLKIEEPKLPKKKTHHRAPASSSTKVGVDRVAANSHKRLSVAEGGLYTDSTGHCSEPLCHPFILLGK